MRLAAAAARMTAWALAMPCLGPGTCLAADARLDGMGRRRMWLGPFFMIIPISLLIVAVMILVRWMGSGGAIGVDGLRMPRDVR